MRNFFVSRFRGIYLFVDAYLAAMSPAVDGVANNPRQQCTTLLVTNIPPGRHLHLIVTDWLCRTHAIKRSRRLADINSKNRFTLFSSFFSGRIRCAKTAEPIETS